MGSVVYASVLAGCYRTVEEAQHGLCNFPTILYRPDTRKSDLLMRRYERYKTLGNNPIQKH